MSKTISDYMEWTTVWSTLTRPPSFLVQTILYQKVRLDEMYVW
jgi:hypothetical protein